MIRLTKGNVQIQFRIERENCENRIYVSKYIRYFSLSIYILLLQHLSFPFNVLRKIHILKYTFIFPTSFRDISSRFCLLTRKKKEKKNTHSFHRNLPARKKRVVVFYSPVTSHGSLDISPIFPSVVSEFSGQNRTEPDRNFFHSSARGKYVYTRVRSFEKFTGRKETILCPRYNRYISLQYLLQLCCTGAINLGKDWRSCNKVGSFHCSKALRISQCDRSSTSSSSFFQSGGKSSSSSSLGQLVVTGGLYWTVNCQRVGKVDVWGGGKEGGLAPLAAVGNLFPDANF